MKKTPLITAALAALIFLVSCGATEAPSAASAAAQTAAEILSTELFTDEDAFPIDLNKESGTVSITAPGNYALSGKLRGQILVETADEGKVKLILSGVEITNSSAPAIYVKNADKVVVSSAEGSINTLSVSGEFTSSDSNNPDAVIFSQDDLNLNGDGVINITSEFGHGVVSKDELKLKGGEVNITAYKKGLSGKDALTIEGGSLTVSSRTHALYSEGDIIISGGELSIASSEKDGIHAKGNFAISEGKVNITQSDEGIEALTITISGGEVSISSSHDGLKIYSSASGSEVSGQIIGLNPYLADDGAEITLSGGTVKIEAGGDSIDPDASFNQSGGELET